jgi:hypothetical protein
VIHNTLANYYVLNFNLMHFHKYSITEIENLIPFERDIYVGLLQNQIEEENSRLSQ